jgi:predicted DNA-binding protein
MTRGRPYLGVKPIHLRVHPVKYAQCKAVAKLRGRDAASVIREYIDAGLERVSSCLKR